MPERETTEIQEKAKIERRDSFAPPVISLEATALALMCAVVHCPDYIPQIIIAGTTATLISLTNTTRHVLKYRRVTQEDQ